MDTNPRPTQPADEIERRLKARAVAQARANHSPRIPNDEVCAEMLREIAELDEEIAALLSNRHCKAASCECTRIHVCG
jgi:maleate cis-trans isomerase